MNVFKTFVRGVDNLHNSKMLSSESSVFPYHRNDNCAIYNCVFVVGIILDILTIIIL